MKAFLFSSLKVDEFKHLLLSLCLFHAVLLERRKFGRQKKKTNPFSSSGHWFEYLGPLGFNIPYEFTDGDLRICMSQLRMFLMEYTEIAYKVSNTSIQSELIPCFSFLRS